MNPPSPALPGRDPLASAVSKVKWHVLPLVLIMFIANYIDRVNVGFVDRHLEASIGIGAAAYGLGAGLFFVGYALFEVPSNLLMQRYGARIWLARIMATWGIVAAAMAFVWNDTSFYALRFLLGAAEAGFFPGVVLYLSQWLPPQERGKAMAIFLGGSAFASVLSGPVTGALLSIRGFGLEGWQWMFLIEGLFSVALCGASWLLLKSHIRDATWLTAEERTALQNALDDERATRDVRSNVPVRATALLRDPQIMLFCFLYFSIQLTIYAATFWLPTIIRKMGGLTDFQVGLYNTIPWMIAIGAMYGFAVLSSKWKHPQRWLAVALVLAACGLFASTSHDPVWSFASICFAALGFKAASSLFWPIPQGYLDTRVAAAVIALINSVGNLGGFVAPTAFGYLKQHTGSITGGLYALAIASLVAAVAALFARTHRRSDPPRGLPADASFTNASMLRHAEH
ncbi:MAG: MFS transporter [Burkholderia contaminans]|uniref:MFS transporter n=3 Tax=Burkholderia TaxID=32008 RepID=A0AAP4VK08_9BURK|nr:MULTISPECIES: MFS transporter [Burkholderia]MBD1413165.1 MFS transporter [Burkholderia contaminans]MBH9672771.1 MFS transporter [Burkholderia contaminans]MBH9680136.1 MFS transporter [Burkholderia contaminans]MBH9710180.1 MFS transporter [Burkholderia contaminans]MBH9725166.1 MFS transporter [Burkholderia contaminans]